MARPRRKLRIGLAIAAASVAIIAGLAGWALDPAALKPRLVEAAARATGRTLTISGRIGIKLSLTPTISMEDVALSNPPGFSRPDMAKVGRVEMGLALLPLLRHRIEVDHITLIRPDILLETDRTGLANWAVRRQAPNAASIQTPPEARTAAEPFTTSVRDISVEDGQVGWLDPSGHQFVAGVRFLTIAARTGGPALANGMVTFDGRSIGVTAQTGALEDLRSASGEAPFPVAAKLVSGDTIITVDGKIARPLEGRGYALNIDADVPNPASLASLLPRLPLRSLGALAVHAEINDNAITALRAKLASADLGTFVHGARLEDATLAASGTSPLKISGRLSAAGFESGISGTVGDLAWLRGGRSAPVTLDLEWNAASARANVKGTIQEPRRFAGFALDVAVHVPDPALVTNGAPPQLKSVVFQTRLTDSNGPVPFQLTANAGDLEGELTIARIPRFSIVGAVSSRRLDLDMLRPAPAVPSAAAPGPAAPPPPEKLIPGTKLPFELIGAADADVKFNFGHLRLSHADVAALDARVLIKDGILRLDPFTVTMPDQHLNAVLVVDAAERLPQVHLTMDAPNLALGPLLSGLGLPQVATGTIETHADLTGTGDTLQALAASLDGWAGIAIQSGQLDARMVNTWLEQLRPLRIDGGDSTDLRCFAVRADASAGVVTIQPAALNTAALILEASGDIDLGHETLALRVRPRTKIGGTGIALPLRVSGPIRAPSAKIDISGSGSLAGLLLGGKDVMGAAGGGDPCPAALLRAREAK